MANPTKITFQLPKANTDGSPLTPAQIADITLLWGTTKGGPYPASYKDTALTPDAAGNVNLLLTALNLPATNATYYLVGVTDGVDGMTSPQSGEISFTYRAAVPNPPAGLTVA